MTVVTPVVRFVNLVLAVLFSAQTFALQAFLATPHINQGDTTKLVIEVLSPTPSLHEIDTSPLLGDFEILGTSSSVQSMVSQNKSNYRARWEIELFPLKTGTLTVPPLEIDGKLTPPLQLEVKQPAAVAAGQAQDVYIEMLAEPQNPYVGQQIIITVRLFHRIRIVNGTLSEPNAPNADASRVGNDISYKRIINGDSYNVLERNFALFANSPGEMGILPVTFRGQIEDQQDSLGSGYSSFLRQVRQIKRSSNELRLTIKEIPASYTGNYWLPASDLRITQQWSGHDGDLQVGNSVNRNIKLIADGLPAESLPDTLMQRHLPGLNIYPDKVTRTNQDIGKKLVGRAEQKYALILSQPGYTEVPALSLQWWDVDEDKQKEILLPPTTLIVNAAAAATPGAQVPTTQAHAPDGNTPHTSAGKNYWRWLALAFLACWLFTLALWHRSGLEKPKAQLQPDQHNWQKKRLQEACLSNNVIQARNQLIAWARDIWPEGNITGLYQLKARVNDARFSSELDSLDAALYSQQNASWTGKALWQAFSLVQADLQRSRQHTPSIIPPLYTPQS